MTAARRAAGLLVVAILVAGAPATLQAANALPGEPPSLHEAVLYHLDFATDIDGTPVDEGDTFVEGVPRVLTLVGWDFVPAGTDLRLRVYQGTRLVYDDTRTTTRERTGGFIFDYQPAGGVKAGDVRRRSSTTTACSTRSRASTSCHRAASHRPAARPSDHHRRPGPAAARTRRS